MAGEPYWQTRLLRADEVASMHELSKACFGARANSEAFIQHRYFGTDGPQVFVVVADVDGRLVGSQAVTLLRFAVAGQDQLVGMFTDGMTHPDHRKKGIFRHLLVEAERLSFERGTLFLFTMPNDESLPAFAKSEQWRILPERLLYIRPVSVRGLLADRGLPLFLATFLGAPVDALLSLFKSHGGARAEELRELSGVATELDCLADRVAREAGGVMCKRDYCFLHWRFEENPTFRYRYFVVRDDLGQLDGYVVTTDERRFGTMVSYVVDSMCTPGSPGFRPLLYFATHRLREAGTRLVGAITSSPSQIATLRRAGFHKVPACIAPRRFHTACAPNPERLDIPAVVSDPRAWLLTLADFDTI